MRWPPLSAAAVNSACPSVACGTSQNYIVSNINKHVQPARPGEVHPLVLGSRLELNVRQQGQEQQQQQQLLLAAQKKHSRIKLHVLVFSSVFYILPLFN